MAGYNVATPWDMNGDPQPTPAAAPAAAPKRKPTEDDEAAYGGNLGYYKPAPTPWDQPSSAAKPNVQTGTPIARQPAQGQRAAPASTPSLNLSPVGAPGASSPAPQTRGLSVVTDYLNEHVAQPIGNAISGGAQTASDKGTATAQGYEGGGWFGKLVKGLRPSVATTPVQSTINTAATTGKPPATPPVELPISFDEGEQSTKIPTNPSDILSGMTPEQRESLTNILHGLGVGRSPVSVGGGADILGPILEAGSHLPGAAGQAIGGLMPGGPVKSPDPGTIASDTGGLDPETILGQLDPNKMATTTDFSKIPGVTAGAGLIGQLFDVLKDPGQWLDDMGKKLGDSAGFNDLGADGFLNDMMKSGEEQYSDTKGVNQRMDAADLSLLTRMGGENRAYQGQRDAAINPYLEQVEGLSNQTQDDANYFNERLHQQMMQTDRDVNAQRGMLGQNYAMMGGLQQQGDAAARASGQYGGQAINFNDPNNAIAQANRGLYDQRAAGTRRAGLADAGVLSALGAQANSNAFAGQPMTGGQLQAAAGASQNRAAQAFATAQQRAQDLQDQGLSRGYEQTQQAYQRNQDALNRQRQSALDLTGESTRNMNAVRQLSGDQQQIGDAYAKSSQNYRDLLQGYGGQRADIMSGRAREDYDIGTGMAGLGHDLTGAESSRDLAALNALYGNQQEGYAGKSKLADSMRTGRLGFTQDLLGNIIKSIPESMKGMGSILSGFGEIVPF